MNTCIFKYVTGIKIYSSISHPPKLTIYSTVPRRPSDCFYMMFTLSVSFSNSLSSLPLSLSCSFSHTHRIASFVFERIQYLSTKSFSDIVELQYDYLRETDNLQLNFNELFVLLFFFPLISYAQNFTAFF